MEKPVHPVVESLGRTTQRHHGVVERAAVEHEVVEHEVVETRSCRNTELLRHRFVRTLGRSLATRPLFRRNASLDFPFRGVLEGSCGQWIGRPPVRGAREGSRRVRWTGPCRSSDGRAPRPAAHSGTGGGGAADHRDRSLRDPGRLRERGCRRLRAAGRQCAETRDRAARQHCVGTDHRRVLRHGQPAARRQRQPQRAEGALRGEPRQHPQRREHPHPRQRGPHQGDGHQLPPRPLREPAGVHEPRQGLRDPAG